MNKHAYEQIDGARIARDLNALADMYKWRYGLRENENGTLDECGHIILLVWFEDLPFGKARSELKRRVLWCMRQHGFDIADPIENACGQYWYMVFSTPDNQYTFEELEQKIHKNAQPTPEQREKMRQYIEREMYDKGLYSANQIADMIYNSTADELAAFCKVVYGA